MSHQANNRQKTTPEKNDEMNTSADDRPQESPNDQQDASSNR